ncbi:MAG: VIT domain-containing protein [Gemmatimonadales bacterium]
MRTIIAVATASLLAAPLAAQGWIEPLPGHMGPAVERVRTTVSVRVTGRIARVEVEEWFQNRGPRLGEGDYLYPLPGEAVFSNFSLFQGDRELRGETMDAQQARAIYQEIVRKKKDPALIELVGHGLIRARVFPINPGERRKITLRYTQLLERAGSALQFQYAAGGTNGHGHATVEGNRPWPSPQNIPVSFRLVADSGAIFADPFSPTHELDISRVGPRLSVRPDTDLTGDFTLFLPFARDVVGVTVATHRPAGEDGYFMLTLSPGRAVGSAQPRDITVVVDVSGSMSGEKIDQARAALLQLLSSLQPEDRFRLIGFSNRVRSYHSDWSEARGTRLEEARNWVRRLSADGGTNIEGALSEAFRLEGGSGRLSMVIFLTDGLPSVGEKNPELLAQLAERSRGDTRVFAFGIGYDVNTYLLDRLSDAGRGSTEYVRPGEDVESAVGQLVSKIQHPVLTDLRLGNSPVELTELYPERLPDLFAGEELVLFGRYRATGRDRSGELTISGQRNNRTERFGTQVSFPAHRSSNDFIPRLWASRKIGYLSQQVRLHGASDDLIEEIRTTALRYGLISEYTSYLVQEPLAVATTPVRDRLQVAPGLARRDIAQKQASGASAVKVAEQDRLRREARNQVYLEAAEDAQIGRAHGPNMRHVAGRMFIDDNGTWTDMNHADSLQVTVVAPYSDAYFRVLDRIPELQRYFSEFNAVLVAGRGLSIKVAAGGTEKLSPLALRRLVEAFRGS